jgi:hypothetical protein
MGLDRKGPFIDPIDPEAEMTVVIAISAIAATIAAWAIALWVDAPSH